jgi:hypothetical protein
MKQPIGLNSLNRYEIRIYGEPDDSLLGLFREVNAQCSSTTDDRQVTTVSDIVMDQAGLVGLIRRLHGLGIVLLSIRQV